MSELIKKYFNLKALDVDEKKKQVKIAIAQTEDVDRDEDVFDNPSFDKTIKENGPNGTNEIWHLLDHTSKTFSALSKFSELGKDGKYIAGISKYKNSFAWREVAWPLYEAGDITQHSVGFEIIKAEPRNQKTNIRIIREVKLYEGSAVLWGAQPDTPTMQIVKGLMNIEEDSDITAAEKIEQLIKQIKKGRYEEDQSLLVIELKRVQYLFDTKQVSKIFEPDNFSIKEFTNEDKMFLKKMIPHHEMAIKMSEEIETSSDLRLFAQGIIETQSSEIEQMKKWLGDKKSTQATKKTTEPGTSLTLPGVVDKEDGGLPEVVDCPNCERKTVNTQEALGYVKCRHCNAAFASGSKFFYINKI